MGRIAGVTADEVRTRLVAAAAEVFATHGYEATRVADIAAAAGLSSGAIYSHYRSKAELLVEAIRSHGAGQLAALLGGDGPVSVTDILVARGAALQDRSRTQGSLLVEAIVAARRDPEVAAVLAADVEEREGFLGELVGQAQRLGSLDPDVPPEVVARFAMMVVFGSLLVRTLDLPATDPADWSRFIARLVGSFSPATPQPEGLPS